MKCGKPIQSDEQEYCYDCSRFEYAFEQGRSLWVHKQPVSGAIYQYKFHNRRCYAAVFAREIVAKYGGWIEEKRIDAIIPVPLHWRKKRKRGFNQAELLAEYILKELKEQGSSRKDVMSASDIIVLKKVLFRVKNTKPQKLLDDRDRQLNLQGAFRVSEKWNPVQTVLLVDDIYTTGATIHRIAKQLKKAGVQKVYFLTISIGQGL